MTLKQTISYILFSLFISVWLVSLLALYLASRIASPFPSTVDGSIMTIFWVATALSAVSSFLIGLDKLGTLGYIRKKLATTPKDYDPQILIAEENAGCLPLEGIPTIEEDQKDDL
jgi:hypothetical protein